MMLKRFLRFRGPVGLMVALWVQQQPVGDLKLQTVALYLLSVLQVKGSVLPLHNIMETNIHYICLITLFSCYFGDEMLHHCFIWIFDSKNSDSIRKMLIIRSSYLNICMIYCIWRVGSENRRPASCRLSKCT